MKIIKSYMNDETKSVCWTMLGFTTAQHMTPEKVIL